MSLALHGAKRSPWAELRRGLARERALIALFDLGRRKAFLLRAARLYAIGVFIGYSVAILLARGGDRRALIHGFVHAALGSLSWAVGSLAALGAAQSLAAPASPSTDPLTALAVGRGYSTSALLRARTLSTAVRVARWVGLPGVLLVVVGLGRGATLLWALAVAPAVIVYASALGLTVALLALFAAQLSPRRPRWVLIALVLVPHLVAQSFHGFPSPVALLSSLLDHLLDSGARLT
ncbi:MAG: hypothetical protein ABUL62_15580 [Myxococcales bacterium]